MRVFGNTQIFGIMGHPVDHSLSPIMHNAAFEALGIHAVYVPFMVKPEDLGKATMALRALNDFGRQRHDPAQGRRHRVFGRVGCLRQTKSGRR